MTTLIPRRRPHATTVCAICGAIYLTTDVHVCTQETPTEGDPMTQYPPPDIRLECLRLAAETGMDTDSIQPTAETWTNFVLGTNQKEN